MTGLTIFMFTVAGLLLGFIIYHSAKRSENKTGSREGRSQSITKNVYEEPPKFFKGQPKQKKEKQFFHFASHADYEHARALWFKSRKLTAELASKIKDHKKRSKIFNDLAKQSFNYTIG